MIKHETIWEDKIVAKNRAHFAPGSWPSVLTMQEYRGIVLMLKEAHIPFDIEDAQIEKSGRESKKVQTDHFAGNHIEQKINWYTVSKEASANGTNLIATNKAFFDSGKIFDGFIRSKNRDA